MPAETFARIKKLVDGEKMIARTLHFARDTTVTIPGICSVATCYGDKINCVSILDETFIV